MVIHCNVLRLGIRKTFLSPLVEATILIASPFSWSELQEQISYNNWCWVGTADPNELVPYLVCDGHVTIFSSMVIANRYGVALIALLRIYADTAQIQKLEQNFCFARC